MGGWLVPVKVYLRTERFGIAESIWESLLPALDSFFNQCR